MAHPQCSGTIVALHLYLLLVGPTYAQIGPGTIFLNGTANISLEKTHRALDEWDIWSIEELQRNVALQGGYFIFRSLAVGWGLNSRVHWEDEYSGSIPEMEDRRATIGFGPLIRWYPVPKSVRFHPFLELGYSFERQAKRSIVYYEAVPETTVKTKLKNSGPIISLGVDWFFNRIVALEPTFYYAVLTGERQVKRPEVPAYNFTRDEPAYSFGLKLRLAIFFP